MSAAKCEDTVLHLQAYKQRPCSLLIVLHALDAHPQQENQQSTSANIQGHGRITRIRRTLRFASGVREHTLAVNYAGFTYNGNPQTQKGCEHRGLQILIKKTKPCLDE
ncbi:uncharacterized protein LAESUDRAFT_109983 [Laetiporus sulphureus 93-53]|uniref:Uncharacterized protein n=1 Tax=Laetiporus sulphureus 93-53 TaxID=1314785 RepID=A0A165ENB8_9APHY|nr:uncharacterized protein LAESUDRAFT_109983 [Laetiporus sulphureus 93-53]KZT07423.1 hypothetical protein LAESUDRAFT_109983 [Laetiporus sulphureus 93-53]